MKKIGLLLVLILVLVLSVSCSNKEDIENTDDTAEENVDTQAVTGETETVELTEEYIDFMESSINEFIKYQEEYLSIKETYNKETDKEKLLELSNSIIDLSEILEELYINVTGPTRVYHSNLYNTIGAYGGSVERFVNMHDMEEGDEKKEEEEIMAEYLPALEESVNNAVNAFKTEVIDKK